MNVSVLTVCFVLQVSITGIDHVGIVEARLNNVTVIHVNRGMKNKSRLLNRIFWLCFHVIYKRIRYVKEHHKIVTLDCIL